MRTKFRGHRVTARRYRCRPPRSSAVAPPQGGGLGLFRPHVVGASKQGTALEEIHFGLSNSGFMAICMSRIPNELRGLCCSIFWRIHRLDLTT